MWHPRFQDEIRNQAWESAGEKNTKQTKIKVIDSGNVRIENNDGETDCSRKPIDPIFPNESVCVTTERNAGNRNANQATAKQNKRRKYRVVVSTHAISIVLRRLVAPMKNILILLMCKSIHLERNKKPLESPRQRRGKQCTSYTHLSQELIHTTISSSSAVPCTTTMFLWCRSSSFIKNTTDVFASLCP